MKIATDILSHTEVVEVASPFWVSVVEVLGLRSDEGVWCFQLSSFSYIEADGSVLFAKLRFSSSLLQLLCIIISSKKLPKNWWLKHTTMTR